MKLEAVLLELEGLAKKVAVRVTYEAIGGELGAGGLCKVKGEWRVIVDKRTTPTERVSILSQALARFPIEDHAPPEEVQKLIDQSRRPPLRKSASGPEGKKAPG